MISRLQYISQGENPGAHVENIRRVLDGGGKWIQLRLKDYSDAIIESVGIQVKQYCQEYQATFILNDWVEVAKKIEADGVHLGQEDMAYSRVRDLLGVETILGVTANTYAQIKEISQGGDADYIGLGPFRFTPNKEKLAPILGLDGYWAILKRCELENISIPILAIGGIKLKDIRSLLESGIYGIAVSEMLSNKNNCEEIIGQVDQYIHSQFKINQ